MFCLFCFKNSNHNWIILTLRTGSGWDRVNFLYSSQHGAVFWICDWKSVDNSPAPWLLLSSTCTASRPFFPLCPGTWVGWGWARSWEGTHLGQLNPAYQGDDPCHVTWSAIKTEGRVFVGGSHCFETDWASIYQWEVANYYLCITWVFFVCSPFSSFYHLLNSLSWLTSFLAFALPILSLVLLRMGNERLAEGG